MKKTALYIQLLMAALVMASCNLFIDEELDTNYGDVPERTGNEYDAPVTQEGNGCKITYQLKRDVRHLGDRDMSYIRNVIRDETGAFVEIHYSADTPQDLLPVPGEALLSGANDKFEWGCCHRVRNCVKEDGVYKVLGSLCNIKEVYETLELDGELTSEDEEAYYVTAEPDSSDVASGRTRADGDESQVGVEFHDSGFSLQLPFGIEASYAQGKGEVAFEMPAETNFIKTTLQAKFDGFTLTNPVFKLVKTDEDQSSLKFTGTFTMINKHKTYRPVKGKAFTIWGVVIVFFVNVDIDLALSGSGSIEIGKHNKTVATYTINLFEGTCEKEEKILVKEPWNFETSVALSFSAEADLMFCFGFYGKVFSVRFGPYITFTIEAAAAPLVNFGIVDASKQEGVEMNADIGIKLQFIVDLTFDGLFSGIAKTLDDVQQRLNHAADLPNLAEVNDVLKNDDNAQDYIKGDDNEKGITIKIKPWHLWDWKATWYPVIWDQSFLITKYWETPDKLGIIAAYRVKNLGIMATIVSSAYCPALRIMDGNHEVAVIFPKDGGQDARLEKDGLYCFWLPDLPPNRQLTAQPCYYRRSAGFNQPSAVDKGQTFYTVTPSVVIDEVTPLDFIYDSEGKYAQKNGKLFVYIFKVESKVVVEGSTNLDSWLLHDKVSGTNSGASQIGWTKKKKDGKYTTIWRLIDRTNIPTTLQTLKHRIDIIPRYRVGSADAALKDGTHYEIMVYSNGTYDIIDDGSGMGMEGLTYEIKGEAPARRYRNLPSVVPDERDDTETEVVIDKIIDPDGEVVYENPDSQTI